MKKKSIIIVVLIIVVAWISLTLVRNYDMLKSQLLGASSTTTAMPPQDVETCLLLAEVAANHCLLQLAIAEKDDSTCDSISKPSQRAKCMREVQLAP